MNRQQAIQWRIKIRKNNSKHARFHFRAGKVTGRTMLGKGRTAGRRASADSPDPGYQSRPSPWPGPSPSLGCRTSLASCKRNNFFFFKFAFNWDIFSYGTGIYNDNKFYKFTKLLYAINTKQNYRRKRENTLYLTKWYGY